MYTEHIHTKTKYIFFMHVCTYMLIYIPMQFTHHIRACSAVRKYNAEFAHNMPGGARRDASAPPLVKLSNRRALFVYEFISGCLASLASPSVPIDVAWFRIRFVPARFSRRSPSRERSRDDRRGPRRRRSVLLSRANRDSAALPRAHPFSPSSCPLTYSSRASITLLRSAPSGRSRLVPRGNVVARAAVLVRAREDQRPAALSSLLTYIKGSMTERCRA